MTDDTACSRTTLAQGAHCKVERCDCGVLHLTIGPVTFRATPEMTESFLATLSEAVHQLALRSPDDCAASPAGRWARATPRTLGDAS
jgi:hypothetical protein